ncbi:MAG TPA: transmembrane 220 family protein [Chlorobiota bacterium]|nr:transmembrane 220 family protein [Chlorobiota bacterium]
MRQRHVPTVLRWLSVVFAGLFLYSTIVQFNDVDAIVWILLYGVNTIGAVMTALRRPPITILWVIAQITFVWSVVVLQSTNGRFFEGEEEREFVGLMICAVWNGVVTITVRRHETSSL